MNGYIILKNRDNISVKFICFRCYHRYKGEDVMTKGNKNRSKRQKNPCNCGVGNRLRKVRTKNGHIVRFIAGVLNLEEDSYRRIEYGINALSADKANVLHRKLGYDLNYIIGGSEFMIEHEYAASDEMEVRQMLSDVRKQLDLIEKKYINSRKISE